MMTKQIFLVLFTMASGITFCQDNKDVNRWIVNAKQVMVSDPVSMSAYLDSINAYVNDHPNEKYISAEYLKLMGIKFYRKSIYDSSIYYYQLAKNNYEMLDSIKDLAKISVNMAMCYNRLSEFKQTILLATDALRAFEKLNDIKGIGIANNIIGQVYFLNNDFEKSLEFFKAYLQNTTDSLERAGGLNNIGSALSETKKYDSALWYFHQALEIHLKLKTPYGIGNAYQNIASTLSDAGRFNESLNSYSKAMSFYKQADNQAGILETTLNIGIGYNKIGEYKIAKNHLVQALDLARSLGEKYMEQKSLLALSNAYENLGDEKKALSLYKDFKVVSDTIFNRDTRSDIEKINIQFETEKKNQQIVSLDQENELKAATIERNYLVITGLILFMSIVALLFYLWLYRNKQTHQAIIREQKIRMRDIQIKAVIDSQENERKRFASDLHDGMGQLISALHLNIHSIKKNEDIEKRMGLVENSEQLLDDIQSEIRNIAFNLMPPVLVKEGLVAAVRELIRRLNKASSLAAELSVHDLTERFDTIVEISIYRIIQELVSNIAKHSHANLIYISFTRHESEVVLTIEDNGIGFDVNKFKQSTTSSGWHTIETRINLIKGDIEFDSLPERKNNTVVIQIPIPTMKPELVQSSYQNT